MPKDKSPYAHRIYTERDVDVIVDYLERGDVVGLPTDTTYGLAVRADCPRAEQNLRAFKQRPDDKPFVWQYGLNSPDLEAHYVWQDGTRRVAKNLWPGPLTMILLRQDTMKPWAVRVSDHAFLHILMTKISFPLAISSANLSGQPSAMTWKDCRNTMPPCPLVMGISFYHQASTVVDMTQNIPIVLRKGPISNQKIQHYYQNACKTHLLSTMDL